jgi:hypothetical protein
MNNAGQHPMTSTENTLDALVLALQSVRNRPILGVCVNSNNSWK